MMKQIRYIVTSLLLLGGLSLAQAQDQEVFPTKNAEWILPMVDWNDHNFETSMGITIFKIEGDTLISGKTYHKLYYSEQWGDYKAPEETPRLVEIGAFRIEGKKVWSTFDNGIHENLLYDFGVNVGDTIWHGTFEGILPDFIDPKGAKYYSVVKSIQLTSFGKEFHVLTYPYVDNVMEMEDVWVEGVGSLHGFFATCLVYAAGNHGFYTRKLWKLTENGELLYPESDPGLPPYGLSFTEAIPVEIEYDQSSERLFVRSDEVLYPCQLKVIDMEGNEMRSFLLNGNGNLSMSGLSSGIYIYSILKDAKVVAVKKIRK